MAMRGALSVDSFELSRRLLHLLLNMHMKLLDGGHFAPIGRIQRPHLKQVVVAGILAPRVAYTRFFQQLRHL